MAPAAWHSLQHELLQRTLRSSGLPRSSQRADLSTAAQSTFKKQPKLLFSICNGTSEPFFSLFMQNPTSLSSPTNGFPLPFIIIISSSAQNFPASSKHGNFSAIRGKDSFLPIIKSSLFLISFIIHVDELLCIRAHVFSWPASPELHRAALYLDSAGVCTCTSVCLCVCASVCQSLITAHVSSEDFSVSVGV